MMNSIKILLAAIFCAAFIDTATAQPSTQPPTQSPTQPSTQPSAQPSTQQSIPKTSDAELWRQITDPNELMRMGRDSCLHNSYRAAARIYCRAFTVGSRMEQAVLNHFATYVADADSADLVGALKIFRNCALSGASKDTVMVRDWLAGQYARAGFFNLETAALIELDLPGASSGRRLAEAARRHFSNRRYRFAATAAAAAHGRVEEKSARDAAAFLAHQSYLQLGIRDSALLWLRASEANNRDAQIQAVSLRQETGLLAEAAALIDSLPASFSKDTLRIRQLVFSGKLGAAQSELLAPPTPSSWAANRRDWMFWRGRCMVFGGQQVYEAAAALDSVAFQSGWHGAAETLRYRYWIQRLEDNAALLGLWGKLEHFIYIGDLTAAAALLKGESNAGAAIEMIAVRLAREFAKAGRHAEGLEVLRAGTGESGEAAGDGSGDRARGAGGGLRGLEEIRGIPEAVVAAGGGRQGGTAGRSAEYLYFTAEMLYALGRGEEARAAIERVLSEFPGDIFAQKARVLLMRINS